MKEIISVFDHGVRLDIPFECCVLYHGRDSIGGLSLGYRLLHFALKKLCGERIPERKEIFFKTAFPGPGLRDAVEMITRAVTENRYTVVENPEVRAAPEGVYGHMYFEVSAGGKTLVCVLKPGVISDEFIVTGRRIKQGINDEAETKHWQLLKEQLSAAVWNTKNMEDVLVSYFK